LDLSVVIENIHNYEGAVEFTLDLMFYVHRPELVCDFKPKMAKRRKEQVHVEMVHRVEGRWVDPELATWVERLAPESEVVLHFRVFHSVALGKVSTGHKQHVRFCQEAFGRKADVVGGFKQNLASLQKGRAKGAINMGCGTLTARAAPPLQTFKLTVF
jgi:hypothetical protein